MVHFPFYWSIDPYHSRKVKIEHSKNLNLSQNGLKMSLLASQIKIVSLMTLIKSNITYLRKRFEQPSSHSIQIVAEAVHHAVFQGVLDGPSITLKFRVTQPRYKNFPKFRRCPIPVTNLSDKTSRYLIWSARMVVKYFSIRWSQPVGQFHGSNVWF